MTNTLLLQLPDHILTNIFNYLSLQDIHNLILTCKALFTIITNDNVLWRTIAQSLQQATSDNAHDRPKRLIIQARKGNNRFPRQRWYNNCRISYNWCHGFYKSKIILQHRVNFMPWIKLHNSEQLFITVGEKVHCYSINGFPNCKKLLWTLETPQIVRNDIRTNDITRFIINEDIFVCGNRDGSTAVYKVDNIRSKPHLMFHINDCHKYGDVEVTAVEVVRSYQHCCIVTASNDSSDIQFWHQDPERKSRDYEQSYINYMHILLDEDIGVKCLAVNGKANKLAIGPNGNNKPMLIDTVTGQLLITNDDSKNRKKTVRDIQWHNDNTVVYVTHSGQLQLLDVRNNEVVYSAIDPFQSTLYCVKSDGQQAIIAGSSEYSRCVLYDICSPHHVQMYFTQNRSSPVYSLDFNTSTLVTAVDRGVAALNFDVCAATSHQRNYSDIFQTC